MDTWAGVVMAAGKGTRMRSKVPKVLHKVCGRELVVYPVEALRNAGISRIVVVAAPGSVEEIKGILGDSVEYVLQAQPLGTGHALLQAAALLRGQSEHVMVLNADLPLIRPATLLQLSSRHASGDPCITLLTAAVPSPDGMGVVKRNDTEGVVEVIEASERSSEEDSSTPTEVNGGAYCFKAAWLWDNLANIEKAPRGEIYLTSMIGEAASRGDGVEALVSKDPQEILGINNRLELSRAEAAIRRRINEHWMLEGVTMIDPDSTFIDASVELGHDTVVYPNTMLLGQSKVGNGCTLGPSAMVQDSVIGDGCRVIASFLEGATVEELVEIGPFSHLRPGTHLESGVHLGNFAEVKNSRLGPGVAMGHFGYVGDASIGANVNLGAGTITCNYDGVSKHRTVVEEEAFIGCDTMLVAPVRVGTRAVTGAGSVITKDVPPRRLAVGVPATIKGFPKTQR